MLTLTRSYGDLLAGQPIENGLWKLTWMAEGTQYEFYLEDRLLPAMRPSTQPSGVIAIALLLTQTCTF